MTDPGLADRTYVEPITRRVRRAGHREGAPRRAAAHAGRPDRPQHGRRAGEGRRARQVRRGDDRLRPGRHRARRGPQAVQRVHGRARHRDGALRLRLLAWPTPRPSWPSWAIPWCCAPRSRWAARAAASRTTWTSCVDIVVARAWSSPRPARCWWRSPSRAGRNSRWRSCATMPATASSCAPSRTSTPWACTRATPSPWPPPRRSTDVEYQRMRAASLAILEKIGVETGGSNVQFAVNPENGRMIVIEMNPRVSRSSAPGVEGHGLPHREGGGEAGRGLHARRDRERHHQAPRPACFEPSIDYCVVKVPRFAFEKFQGTDDTLSTRMKAVGEVMAIGRTFEEALGKAMRSPGERPRRAWAPTATATRARVDDEALDDLVARPTAERIFYVAEALRRGWTVEHAARRSRASTRSSCTRMADIVTRRRRPCAACAWRSWTPTRSALAQALRASPTRRSPHLTGTDELTVRTCRKMLGVAPGVQDRGHLRRRVPQLTPPTTTRPTTPTRPRWRRRRAAAP